MTHDAGLGRVLVRHEERNGWRLLLGAVVTGGGVLSAVEAMTIAGGGTDRVVHWVVAVALAWPGGRLLARALRAGTGEYVEVREDGLVHATAAGVVAWPWDAFASVRVGHHTDTFVLRCVIRIRFAGGSRLTLSLWGRRTHEVGGLIAAGCRRHGRPVVERDVASF
ncbi:hypothetical protein E1212_19560 [Jiangella ureilytica]|uniref:PH domain-containing protein n=1 Tax=Jiangella ureilytica TaxID=2530374 RepID=A0A4R4RHM6_9ACTN|nr:hypothetical protein [Jiangella ureilytica]TDC48927.1 hypothetical protein E1212_19560 [Jiangella ureilytica]